MKVTRAQLQALINEAMGDTFVLPGTIQVGETYTTREGHKLSVTEIYINVMLSSGSSTTWVVYDYETSDGKTGVEKNTVGNFIKLLNQ